VAGATSRPRMRSPRPLSDAVSARRSRHCYCFALCEVRCPTWFQPAACSFYGHLVSSASEDDCRLRRRVAPALRARALLWCGARGLRGAALPIRRCAVRTRQASWCSQGHFSWARFTTRAFPRGALRVRHGSAALPIRRRHAARRLRGVATCPVVKCGQPPCRTHARAGTLFDSPPTRETCAQVRGVAARAARRGRSAGERTVPEPCPVSSCARLGSRSDPAAADGCAEWRCGAGVTRVVGACAAAGGVR